MEIYLKKQPKKYLSSVTAKVREQLLKCLDDIAELKGDIKKLAGTNNMYRYKIHHYRILFTIDKDGRIIIVETINTRTNIKY